MTVDEIMAAYLTEHGFDGLYSAEGNCHCLADDLFPCGVEGVGECEAVHVASRPWAPRICKRGNPLGEMTTTRLWAKHEGYQEQHEYIDQAGQILAGIYGSVHDQDGGWTVFDERTRPNTFLGTFDTLAQAKAEVERKMGEAQ